MRRALLLVPLVGCTWVAEAQYDDRANELEAFRSEFLPGSANARYISAADNRFYWVSLEKPLDQPLLHSYDPATEQRIDYEWSRGDTSIEEDFVMSGQLIADCSSASAVKVYDAAMPNVMIAMTNMGSTLCSIDGREVYFRVNREIRRWTPGAGNPVRVVDMDAAMIGTGSIVGFAVLKRQLLLAEGSRLWLIDTNTGKATWLENTDTPTGKVVFDERGVLFDVARGASYIAFADHSMFRLDEAIRDGGYRLNSTHADIQVAAGSGDYALWSDHIVYRSIKGIFAYGLDSTKVIDLLFDRGESYDSHPRYRDAWVTADGTLFVWDNFSSAVNAERPVYRVTLSGGRLR